MYIKEIETRYSNLVDKTCCLSCGGAFDFANANSGEVCIDLGSGRGNDVFRMVEAVGENGFVYGIDATAAMVEKAKKTAEKFEFKNVKFLLSDIEKIDLPDGLADLIISNCTINHSIRKNECFKEIFRLLKKGGRIVISDIYSLEIVPDEYKNDPVAVSECWAGAITKEEYLEIIFKNGFENIKILEESVPYEKGEIKVASFTVFANKPAF